MPKFIRMSHPSFRIGETSLKNVELYREDLNNAFKFYLRKDIQERYYQSMGCSKSEFEQIYKKKLDEYEQLEKYLRTTNGIEH